MQNHLRDKLAAFRERDTLTIGICNGFQILANLGFLPGALILNDNARYTDRFVDIKVTGAGPWLHNIKTLSVPIAHGEGKFYADARTLAALAKKGQVAFTYTKGEMCKYQKLAANPNGSLKDIAGVTDATGRVLGLMPHPERAMFMTQLPNWTFLREDYRRRGEPLPEYGPGLQVFRNAVDYFAKA
jgi:phosphoribosylformylglycinamidine (FGAM) synthase-like amidotransferase family enzyme